MAKTRVAARSPLFYSKVPGGIPSIVDAKLYPGNIFYVDGGDSAASDTAGFGSDPDAPFATIDFAINQCTANQGDVIFVLAGHTETLSSGTIMVLDVAGISIIGLGRGADRPTLTISATGGNIPISGAGIVFENFLILTTGTIDATAGITVTAADVLIKDVEMRESATDSQIVDGIVVATGGARCRIENFRFLGAAGDAGASGISITGAVDGVEIIRPNIDGTLSAGAIENVSGVCTNIVIDRPILRNRHSTQDGCVVMVATSTGFLISPWCRTATNDAGGFNGAIVFAAGQVYDPLVVNDDGQRGGAWGTASSA